jgi:hypothetical protein
LTETQREALAVNSPERKLGEWFANQSRPEEERPFQGFNPDSDIGRNQARSAGSE